MFYYASIRVELKIFLFVKMDQVFTWWSDILVMRRFNDGVSFLPFQTLIKFREKRINIFGLLKG